MFCPKCGQQIANDAKFCGFCGATIVQDPQPQVAPAPVPEPQQQYQQPQYQQPQYQQQYQQPQYQQLQQFGQPRNPVSPLTIDAKTILYMVACLFQTLAFIFWWIPSIKGYGEKYSLLKTYNEMGSTFPAVIIIIFLIVCLCLLVYYAVLNQLTKNALEKFDKPLKLSVIVMQLMTLLSIMTVMGPMMKAEMKPGFPVIAVYISLIGAILVEAYAYFITEKK